MKKSILLTIIFAAIFAGCSATWEGVKDDSSDAYDATKQAIHEATE